MRRYSWEIRMILAAIALMLATLLVLSVTETPKIFSNMQKDLHQKSE